MVEYGGIDHRNVKSEGKSSSVLSCVDKAKEWHWAVICRHAYGIVAAQGCTWKLGPCCVKQHVHNSDMNYEFRAEWEMATVRNTASGLRVLRISCWHCTSCWRTPSGVCCRCSISVAAGVLEMKLTNSRPEQQKLFWRSDERGHRRGQC